MRYAGSCPRCWARWNDGEEPYKPDWHGCDDLCEDCWACEADILHRCDECSYEWCRECRYLERGY